MAALILEARAARADARRLRQDTAVLRQAVRDSSTLARARHKTALAATLLACERRNEPLPSPWSTLYWRQTDEALEQTLVPVP